MGRIEEKQRIRNYNIFDIDMLREIHEEKNGEIMGEKGGKYEIKGERVRENY